MSVSKSNGGTGFRDLYGFNIALLGKHVWNFMHKPQSLVSRVYRARYFSDGNVLKAGKGSKPSFIWSGIHTAKEELKSGFRWVLGNGNIIITAQDPWLKRKSDFRVEASTVYNGNNELVSHYFEANQRRWNTNLVRECFLPQDAEAILAVHIPQRDKDDRVAWMGSTNGVYSVKSGLRHCYNLKVGVPYIIQSLGWKKVWHLRIAHKVKIFI